MKRTKTSLKGWKVVGRFQRSSPRYGFVVPEGKAEDVYVPSRYVSGALDGDEVEVEVRRNARSGLLEGRIVRIVHRPQQHITGKVTKTRGGYVVLPDNPRFPAPLGVLKEKHIPFVEGDRVVATLVARGRDFINRCRITEVLGDSEDARLDSLIIARELGIPTCFGERAEAEASVFSEAIEAGRTELTDARIFTIDPADARDFDDAVSVRELRGGSLEVGVHIADVSSFVERGTAIDIEAMERGNSVYMPDSVFPMLPARLSNSLCSLEPLKPRQAISIIMELAQDGTVLESRFLETTITSVHRFTYDEVQAFLDGKLDIPGELGEDLRRLDTLARKLKERREERNAIDLELPELKVKLTPRGEPEALFLDEQKQSYALIEELMILANREIGSRVKSLGIPFIYRVHPKAKKEKVEEFLRAARVIAQRDFKRPRGDAREFGTLLDSGLDEQRARLLHSFFIRSMEKARYDVSDIGHYGLALDGYCHFTSPIRRYTDLLDHRIVRHALIRRGKKLPGELEARLPVAAELCSEREVRADEAEREATRVKALRFVEKSLGDVLEGMIVGVIHSGLFVELSGCWVEGMVPKDVLRDDAYYFDEGKFALVGRRRGRRYCLGQTVKVQIAKVDPLARMMDLVPVR